MKKASILQKARAYRISLFRGHLLLMILMLVIALLPLLISSRILTDTLSEYYLNDLQKTVEQGCDEMSAALYRTCAIPASVRGNKYYDDLVSAQQGDLPQNHPWMLTQMSAALGNQVYLAGDSVERLVYFPNSNSICTNRRCFANAEDCFDKYLAFSETDTAALLGLLQDKHHAALVPAQEIRVDGAPMNALALVVFPVETDVSVMALYREETILSYLGIDELPEGSFYRILDGGGSLILEGGDPQAPEQDCHELTGKVRMLGLSLHLWVPADYFSQLLHPAYRISLLLSLISAVIGILFCVLFADISTRRIRRLVEIYPAHPRQTNEMAVTGNEVDYLEYVIRESKSRAELLQQQLFSGALVRAFSGALLSGEDEELLAPCFSAIDGDYRVALIHAPADVVLALDTTILPENLSEAFFCETISDKSIGVLFSGDSGLKELEGVLRFLNRAVEKEKIVCGVSDLHTGADRLQVAVRQARIALQDGQEGGIYSDKRQQKQKMDGSMLWLQHERIYQSILSRNGVEASALILDFIRNTGGGQEAFYNTLFILHSAAGELGVEATELETVRYDARITAQENADKLIALLQTLLAEVAERERLSKNDFGQQLLTYIRDNISDPGLCLNSAADHFGVSAKSIYALIRELTGMTFREYTLQVRMKRAAQLLCGAQMGIAEIAQSCGYPAVSTFFRVFKNYFDCTPGQYRQNTDGTAGGQEEK